VASFCEISVGPISIQREKVEDHMKPISIVIDGTDIQGTEGMTILEVSEKGGVEIPTLCHRPELTPDGSCRICVVEVEGQETLVGACHTPVREGMIIRTTTPRVRAAVRATLELLLAGHSGPCLSDPHAHECELHLLASKLELGVPRFQMNNPRSYPIETISPYVQRDLSRCILCNRCIRACQQIAGHNIFSKSYRGIRSKVTVDLDEQLDKQVCRDCGICIEYCPTTALLVPSEIGEDPYAA
jgi:predicted molibdopterin-dependent oxidoreductase YjgC